jgi:hypothetical protein
MLLRSSKRSTLTNAKVNVVTLGGTLGEFKASVIVLGELLELVDRCLALIPSMVSLDFNKGKPFDLYNRIVAYTIT